MTDSISPDERRPLPSVLYNPTTMVGGSIAAVSLGLILFLMLLEFLTEDHKPYMGILAFVVLPVFLIFGLLLVAVGAWREHRRRQRGEEASIRLPAVDLNDPRHRRAAIGFTVITLGLLLLSGFGSFKAYEYTDSDEFCGTVCHTVMEPEYTAYRVSPHARVGCVQCHIGPGAEWFVRSKLSGAYQVYSVLFDKYSRPIETPVHNLRPSRDTCEQCHWPSHFYEENLVTHDYYLPDEGNTHMRVELLMKIGGGFSEAGPTSGIHWHLNANHQVSYIATDERRQEIPWVKVTGPDGQETIYRNDDGELSEEELAAAEIRTMDCIDCHNRPSHHYWPPATLVNRLMGLGLVPPSLPEIKSVAVEALEGSYANHAEAMAGIAQAVREHFSDGYPLLARSRAAEIETSIAELQRVYGQNFFPTMGVSWEEFPDNIGHLTSPGCFRCHDGEHVSDDGRVLSRDCNQCHTILAQKYEGEERQVNLDGLQYRHPEDIDEAWRDTNCSDCHGG